MPIPAIIPPSSPLYVLQAAIQLTVSYRSKSLLILAGHAAFIRCQSVRRPSFVLIQSWRFDKVGGPSFAQWLQVALLFQDGRGDTTKLRVGRGVSKGLLTQYPRD